MLKFIDYSEAFFVEVEKATVPQFREGKFVQIANQDDEYIVFAPKPLCKYHSHIVARFAELHGLGLWTERSRDAVQFADPDWRIIGGGKMSLDAAKKTVVLGGSSQVYGTFRHAGLAERIAGLNEFEGFTVRFAD